MRIRLVAKRKAGNPRTGNRPFRRAIVVAKSPLPLGPDRAVLGLRASARPHPAQMQRRAGPHQPRRRIIYSAGEGSGRFSRRKISSLSGPICTGPRPTSSGSGNFPAYAVAEAQGMPLGQWARTSYDPRLCGISCRQGPFPELSGRSRPRSEMSARLDAARASPIAAIFQSRRTGRLAARGPGARGASALLSPHHAGLRQALVGRNDQFRPARVDHRSGQRLSL